MKFRFSTTWLVILFVVAALTTISVSVPLADPILKPKKYHGPIPKRSFGISIGFLAGTNNEEMWGFLDRSIEGNAQVKAALQTDDFASAPEIDVYYNAKVHPNFAFRLKAGAAFLDSKSTGLALATEVDTSGTRPVLAFERDFDVTLLSVEATGLYYFQDASVSEFQAYFGAGFTVYFPLAKYEASSTLARIEPSGEIVDTGVRYSSRSEKDESIQPGVHGIIGALYHVRNNLAFFGEGRYQIGQSQFSLLLPVPNAGEQKLNFIVDYSGFVLTLGVSRFF